MYDVQDICGTLYGFAYETKLGFLYQSILWSYNHLRDNDVSFAYGNIRSIVLQRIRDLQNYTPMEITPLTAVPYAEDGQTNGRYCSYVTSEDKDKTHHWQLIFDGLLHDTAVTYIHLLGKESDPVLSEIYERLAVELFCLSRQLRVDVARGK